MFEKFSFGEGVDFSKKKIWKRFYGKIWGNSVTAFSSSIWYMAILLSHFDHKWNLHHSHTLFLINLKQNSPRVSTDELSEVKESAHLVEHTTGAVWEGHPSKYHSVHQSTDWRHRRLQTGHGYMWSSSILLSEREHDIEVTHQICIMSFITFTNFNGTKKIKK